MPKSYILVECEFEDLSRVRRAIHDAATTSDIVYTEGRGNSWMSQIQYKHDLTLLRGILANNRILTREAQRMSHGGCYVGDGC